MKNKILDYLATRKFGQIKLFRMFYGGVWYGHFCFPNIYLTWFNYNLNLLPVKIEVYKDRNE